MISWHKPFFRLSGDTVRLGSLLLLLSLMAFVAACGSPANTASPEIIKEDKVLRVAHEYADDHDLDRAKAELDGLDVPNVPQWVNMLAQQHASAKDLSPEDIQALAALAYDLGMRDEALLAILGTPTSVPTPVPTDTPVATPSPTSTATSVPPTSTPVAPTATPIAPQAIARGWTNVREGPGKAYPRVGHLIEGEIVKIVGQNPKKDWWQICCWGNGNSRKGWVFKDVIDTKGPVDEVPVVTDFPPLPSSSPQPTAKPSPKASSGGSGVDFVIKEQRLWTVEENGGRFDGPSLHCGYGHEIHVLVEDANGQPLDGIVVERVYAKERGVSGTKGPGRLEFSLFSTGDMVRVVGDVNGNAYTSETSRNLDVRDDQIPVQDLIAAHYCPDAATCQKLVAENHLCRGHYSWTVVFQKQG